MASTFLLFILLCIFLIAWSIRGAFKTADGYVIRKEPKWIAYKDEKGRIKTYKTRWAEQC